MSHTPIKHFFVSLASPVEAIQFLRKRPFLLLLGILPHVLNIILYVWFVAKIVIAKWLHPLLTFLGVKWESSFVSELAQSTFLEAAVWFVAVVLYGALGTAFVNAVASPIYDILAQKAFETTAGRKMSSQTFMDFIDSIVSEVTKGFIILSVMIISLFLSFLAPFFLLASIWYLGWNHIDRTLLLLRIPFRQRLVFGLKNAPLCFGLGAWSYIPLLNALLAFTLAVSGAILVAKHSEVYRAEDENTPGADF